MTHLEHLLLHIPDLEHRSVLDLGSGKGTFLIEATKRGIRAEGIEYNPRYIALTKLRAREDGITVRIQQGRGERLPFNNESFDFINVCEVLEHVQNLDATLAEIARVLTSTGIIYVSIPNRFGFIDPHYKIAFINWLPRAWADIFLKITHKQKHETYEAGLQKLSEMHYLTRKSFLCLLQHHGLSFLDTRELKIKKILGGFLIIPLYRFYSLFFVSTFHGLAKKINNHVTLRKASDWVS